MPARIALLGWGSLLWDGDLDFDAWHEPWQFGDGPSLMIEFSRISCSRGGALTLVIDPDNGACVRVAWCLSRRQSIDEVIEDLRRREQTACQKIGRFTVNGASHGRDTNSLGSIGTWATERDLDGVVWTDLHSNFEDIKGEPFSVDAAMRYLTHLDGASKVKAETYFREAPPFVETPLRNAFNACFRQI